MGCLLNLRNQILRHPNGVLQQLVCQSKQHGTFSISAGLSAQWWNTSIYVDAVDLYASAKQESLPELSQYFVYSKTLNTQGVTKSKTITSWYVAYDVVNSTIVDDAASYIQVSVQEPAGSQRWHVQHWERLHCLSVVEDYADRTIRVFLRSMSTSLSRGNS